MWLEARPATDDSAHHVRAYNLQYHAWHPPMHPSPTHQLRMPCHSMRIPWRATTAFSPGGVPPAMHQPHTSCADEELNTRAAHHMHPALAGRGCGTAAGQSHPAHNRGCTEGHHHTAAAHGDEATTAVALVAGLHRHTDPAMRAGRPIAELVPGNTTIPLYPRRKEYTIHA